MEMILYSEGSMELEEIFMTSFNETSSFYILKWKQWARRGLP